MAISRRRAESARALLTGRYGADPARVEAFGMGYFAPVASNATPEGREANRRVEAVVTSTE
jgi:OOP family OmpA-OmpF porin